MAYYADHGLSASCGTPHSRPGRPMSMHRSVQILTVLTTLAACAPMGRNGRGDQDRSSVTVQWDSGPLDRDYARQRSDMDARHTQEIANPRADESSDQRSKR